MKGSAPLDDALVILILLDVLSTLAVCLQEGLGPRRRTGLVLGKGRRERTRREVHTSKHEKSLGKEAESPGHTPIQSQLDTRCLEVVCFLPFPMVQVKGQRRSGRECGTMAYAKQETR